MGLSKGTKVGIVIIAIIALAGSVLAEGVVRALIELCAFIALLSLVWKARQSDGRAEETSGSCSQKAESEVTPEV
ncbi:hypothetical protein L2750_12695 [Shewanella submarina]|uniref:Uncharacterized protein n=1 Tax=Shewanella submarina TaxID=2016376 RepID=A0ABV7GDK5_9GAMM|nr:hypothetical protein [Shewanella submarina]MCL1038008.1 hypothetical protein [Shewanella submarina]